MKDPVKIALEHEETIRFMTITAAIVLVIALLIVVIACIWSRRHRDPTLRDFDRFRLDATKWIELLGEMREKVWPNVDQKDKEAEARRWLKLLREMQREGGTPPRTGR